MKYIFGIILTIAVALGIVAVIIPSPQHLVEENDPLGGLEATTCVAIGPAGEDPIIYNLDNADEYGHDDLHHVMEYEDGVWFMDGEFIGVAENEDEGFDACGTVDFMQPIIAEREEIIKAGGYGS